MKKMLLLTILGLLGVCGQASAISVVTTPYQQTFDSNEMPDGWAAFDDNHDGKTWIPYFNKMEISEFLQKFNLDDWLVTPGVILNPTRKYVLEFKGSRIWGQDDNLTTLEVRMDMTDDYKRMQHVVVEPYKVDDYFPPSGKYLIRPLYNGPHFFAFHATGVNSAGIALDDFVIREATMPSAIEDLQVERVGDYGSSRVNVSFTAPTTNFGGDRLMSLDRIEVVRSGVLVKQYDHPAPGQKFLFEDDCTYGSGHYHWEVTAYGADGQKGYTATSKVIFVGINVPAAPGNVKLVERDHSGEVTLSWDLVTTDREGLPMPAEFIDYRVNANGDWLVETGATSPFTFQAVDPDEQVYLVAMVNAMSSYGSSTTTTPLTIVGKMYTTFNESFDNGNLQTKLHYEVDPDLPAELFVFDNDLLGMYAGVWDGDADDTNGCMAISAIYSGYNASIGIGKYDFSTVENPVLKFYTFFPKNEGGTPTANIITVQADRGMGYNDIFAYNMADHPDVEGWQLVSVDLSRFKDKLVALKIRGQIVNMPFVLLDGISVSNQCDYNLVARKPRVTEKVKVGESLEVDARVENIGNFEATGAKMVLMLDGEEFASQDIDPILPAKNRMVNFKIDVPRTCGPEVAVSVRVVYDKDEDLSDNLSPESTFRFLLPNFPAVTDLSAQEDLQGNVNLSWSTPSLEIVPVRIEESFEEGEPNAIDSYGDWTFVDGDGLPTLIIDPNDRFPFQGQTMAGAIADAVGHYMPYFPLTGDRFLAMCGSEDGPTDDWAISPLLTGEAQTVTFWARSWDSYGMISEPFGFMISSTGKDVADFTIVEDMIYAGGTWTQYSIDVPEGTKYFAINYKTSAGLMLMLDEFSFIPADTGEPLEVKGYNYYRDGEQINTEAIAENDATDLRVPVGEHTYHVTTIFNRGESPASNAAKVKVTTGVQSAATADVKISGASGAVVVTAPEPVRVLITDVAGRKLVERNIHGTAALPMAPGTYIVTAGETTAKVAVH